MCSSSLSSRSLSSSFSSGTFSSKTALTTFIPVSSALLSAPLSYAISSGFSPALSIASVGTVPFFFNASVFSATVSSSELDTSAPFSSFPIQKIFSFDVYCFFSLSATLSNISSARVVYSIRYIAHL